MKIQEYYYCKWLFYDVVWESSIFSTLPPEDLEDTFSEVFYEAFKKWHYNKVNYFKRLVNWRLIDLYNKNKEHEEYSFIDWMKNDNCYQFNYKDWKDIDFVLKQILHEKEYELILKYYIDELTQEEIATDYNVSRRTIQRWLRDIKEKIVSSRYKFEWILF